jgi:uncharacterized protein (UPF0303 family)
MDINIHIAQVSMSDGSNCYDVNVNDVCDGRTMSQLHFSAVTEQDAFKLAEKMKQLIDEHTVDAVGNITCNY